MTNADNNCVKYRLVCEQAVQDAGLLVAKRFGDPGTISAKSVDKKSGRSFDVVTEVDLLSEQIILQAISEDNPDSIVLTEEGGLVRAGSANQDNLSSLDQVGDDLLWLVDPLDGTINFAHNIPHFCVSVACWRKDKPVAGAIYDPITRELFSFQGQGASAQAFYQGDTFTLSNTAARACDSVIFVGGSAAKNYIPVMRRFRSWRRLGSAALSLAWVATGRCGAYVQPGSLNAWDWGAGVGILLASGGRIVKPSGAEWEFTPASSMGLVAMTPSVVNEVLPILHEQAGGI